MTRPIRNQSRPRPIKKETNFSEEEWQQAELAAQATDLSFQAFMRMAVLAQKIRPKRHQQSQNLVFALSKLMAELGRVGGNINQLAKQANLRGYAQDTWGLEEDRAELKRLLEAIGETIKKV